jgi:hypothetical protein
MFFRRRQPHLITFDERLETLRQAGFRTQPLPDGRVKVTRGPCAAIVSPDHIERAGWILGDDIGLLVDAGFQKFWSVGGERRAPGLASQLAALHAFEEDLREALGLESLYNTSLGTINDLHLYDRLQGREEE